MTRKDILLSIRELSHARHARDFVEVAGRTHPSDMAEVLSALPRATALALLEKLDAVAREAARTASRFAGRPVRVHIFADDGSELASA